MTKHYGNTYRRRTEAMAKFVTIDGKDYRVTENLGFNHSIGLHAVEVETSTGPRVAVQHGGWKWWTLQWRPATDVRGMTEED